MNDKTAGNEAGSNKATDNEPQSNETAGIATAGSGIAGNGTAGDGTADNGTAGIGTADPTVARVEKFGSECSTPKEAHTSLLSFLTESDVNKTLRNTNIPFFTGGCHVAVTYADRASPTGLNKFVGICIARRNKGLGTTFILRNVIGHIPVERMFELYSPQIKKIDVLRLERRRRAKLYYLRDKPLNYSKVDWNAEPDTSNKMRIYKRKRGAPA